MLIALTGDIQQAYLNVDVEETDRPFLRFLWVDDIHSLEAEIVAYQFTRVIFGITPSQFLLLIVIIKHLEKYEDDVEFIEAFLRSLYSDDCIAGAQSITAALEMYVKSRQRLAEAGFTLRKWHSNDVGLEEKFKQESGEASIEEDLKVLGVPWDNKKDYFEMKFEIAVNKGDSITKRNVLKAIAGIYDPLGLLAPLTIVFKLLFQVICNLKIGWDKQICSELNCKWESMVALASDTTMQVPRYYFGEHAVDDLEDIMLHGFADASKRAYAAVIYITGNTGETTVGQFVVCKTRVASSKRLTIPKLELSSCLLLAKLVKSVKSALAGVVHIAETYCWNDSMDSLYWIKETEKRRDTFVQNRVKMIRSIAPDAKWRFCPGA